MAREQDRSEQFEWVNAWASSIKTDAAPVVESQPERPPEVAAPEPVLPSITYTPLADQLKQDIADIERTRDALAALPLGTFSVRRRTQALTLVPARTSDPVPVVIGGVLALVMLTVFGAAAAMTKLSR
jgi:hypothetical protein